MRALLCVFTILAAGANAFCADKETEELLAKMRAAYSQVKTAKFATKSVFRRGKDKEFTANLSTEFAAPNKLRSTVTVAGQKVEVYCDGKSVLQLGPANRIKSDYSLDALGQALPANLESLCFFDWKRQLSTAAGGNMKESILKIAPKESWNGRTWIVLEEKAPKQKVFVKYYIDPGTYLIWRTKSSRTDQNFISEDYQLTSLTLGGAIDAKRFQIPK